MSRWTLVSLLLLALWCQISYGQDDEFKIITADPWIQKTASVTVQSSKYEDLCEKLHESNLFGNKLLRCAHEAMPSTILFDGSLFPNFETDQACKTKVGEILKTIFNEGGVPVVKTLIPPTSVQHEVVLQERLGYVEPDECLTSMTKTMKVTKLGVSIPEEAFEEFRNAETFNQVGHHINLPFALLPNILPQVDSHFVFHNGKRLSGFFEFYEEPDSKAFKQFWNVIALALKNVEKVFAKLTIVTKITETTESCTVAEKEVAVIAFTMILKYSRPSNADLLNMRNDDSEPYKERIKQADRDLKAILTEMQLTTYVWSSSVDALQIESDNLIARVYIKIALNKMPADKAEEYLTASPLSDHLSQALEKISPSLRNLKPEIDTAVIAKSKIGCQHEYNE